MKRNTYVKDTLGQEIYEGDTILTQIDGFLKKWFKGKVVYRKGCFGIIPKNQDYSVFHPMCYFYNMRKITSKKEEKEIVEELSPIE